MVREKRDLLHASQRVVSEQQASHNASKVFEDRRILHIQDEGGCFDMNN